MPDSILDSWFNGVELGDVKDVIKNLQNVELTAKATLDAKLKTAGQIVELTQTEGWQALSEKIEELKKYFIRTPEDYYQNKEIAGVDAGARAALTLLTNWIQLQHKLIDNYANRGNQQPGA